LPVKKNGAAECSPGLRRRMLQLFMKFAGEPLAEDQLDQMIAEIERS
jgi:hypothetical protein